ncbi:MAG: cell division protein SepF [Candidatus Paraimprobicoccus trichonymphae]|uniref:Cell division protein SepF n=1 Tax=Candidatus Paraimprobicoccus trichonymphae TaxID=3033793 RepID=A0AA48KW23_9FIRM|nr:MAG: cell division protein SepF [Candidatus Paraimprobicoccus trichonymphae]
MPGFIKKIKEMWNPSDLEYEENYENEEETTLEERQNKNKKIVSIHNATCKSTVVLFKAECFNEEVRNVANELLKMHTVILNLEKMNQDSCKRTLDFVGGVVYAVKGYLQKVSENTYVAIPQNTEFIGSDVTNELENRGIYF